MIALILVSLFPCLPQDPAPEPAAQAPPEDVIPLLIETVGGLDAWQQLPGLRYDLLESRRYLTGKDDSGPKTWKAHSHLPILHHTDLRGNGYQLCEYINRHATAPEYRRLVVTEGTSWAEQSQNWTRGVKSATEAAARIRKEFFLGSFPFSLSALRATSTYLRTDPAGADRDVWVYLLALPQGIRFEHSEKITEFLMYVDPMTRRVRELRFRFVGDDRYHPGVRESWASVYLAGDVRVGGCVIPHKRTYKYDASTARHEWWVEDARAVELPAAALRRPWYTQSLWQWTDRCDFWDPPVPAEGDVGAGEEPPGGGGGKGG